MLMAALAWTGGLALAGRERHAEQKRRLLRMDISIFRQALVLVPAQVLRAGVSVGARMRRLNDWSYCVSLSALIMRRAMSMVNNGVGSDRLPPACRMFVLSTIVPSAGLTHSTK